MDKHEHDSLIDAIGGTVATARLCDISPQAVTQWRRSGIPRPRLMYLQLLRPDVFGQGQARAASQSQEARHAG
jgi:hypothetical protein